MVATDPVHDLKPVNNSWTMTFLHRRRSQPLLQLKDEAAETPPSTPLRRTITSSIGKAAAPGRLIRHVSTIFSLRKKSPAPVCNVAVGFSRRRLNSLSFSSSSNSIDDIRRPSGLGPQASSTSSNLSLPPPPPPIRWDEDFTFDGFASSLGFHERTRAISTPNLLRPTSFHVKEKPQNNYLGSRERELPPIPVEIPDIPPEVLEVILSFLPRYSIASLAPISQNFCSAARNLLYGKLDLCTIRPTYFDQLNILLAARRDLADIVHTLVCHTWSPSFFLHFSHGDTRISLLSPSTATFTIALKNMNCLTSLTLPSFDLALMQHHSAFGLKSITFLNQSMSSREQRELFTWMDGQTNISSLAFPNLLENTDSTPPSPNILSPHTHLHTRTNSTNPFLHNPIPSNCSTFAFIPASPRSSYPYNSTTLLPALTTLHAPPLLTMLLASTRHLTHVTLTIDATLYTGLRPAALMSSLRGVTNLGVRFRENVDRRTVEKVLGAAGAMLGEARDGDDGDECEKWSLETLMVEVAWMDIGTDETLYKIVHTVLPRFRTLRTLLLHLSSSSPASSCPSSASSFMADDSDIPAPGLTEHDHVHINLWLLQCSSLRTVTLLSGAEWRSGV